MSTLLVADDDPISLEFLTTALSGSGWTCTTATNGRQAVEQASLQAFDLLLLDAQMPELDGIAALKGVRHGQTTSCDSPAVATTASNAAECHATLIEAGFDAVLVKPIGVAELGRALAGYRQPCGTDAPLIETARALDAVGGHDEIASALLALLLTELVRLPDELSLMSSQSNGRSALAERMHRLRASAGFCGVPRLEWQAMHLERVALRHGGNWPEAPVERFRKAVALITDDLQQALDR